MLTITLYLTNGFIKTVKGLKAAHTQARQHNVNTVSIGSGIRRIFLDVTDGGFASLAGHPDTDKLNAMYGNVG